MEGTILGILTEVYECLENLDDLRGKYAMDLTPRFSSSSTLPRQVPSCTTPLPDPIPAPTGLTNVDPLFSSSRVAATLSQDTAIRQGRNRASNFFCKVNFGWPFSSDVSGKVKLEEALKTLRDLNDRLEMILLSSNPSGNGAGVTRRLVSLKMLSVAAKLTELRSIGEAMVT